MTDTTISIGIQDVQVAPGDHICALFRGSEGRDAILGPFIREAVRQHDKVVGLFDESVPESLLDVLAGDEAHADVLTGQLELFTSDETYLAGGRFDRDALLAFLTNRVTSAVAEERFRFVRAFGEMTWALRDVPGVKDLIRYESDLNLSVWRHGSKVSMCLYDLERFTDGGLVIDILRTHPKVLLGGTVLCNPWYVQPEDLPAA